MKIKIKWNFTLMLASIVVVLGLALAYYLPRAAVESRAQAQSFTDVAPDLSGDIVCDEVIPIGSAFDNTKILMEAIYQEYTTAQTDLDLAIANLVSQLADLTSPNDSAQVCDFKACQSPVNPATGEIDNPGPPLALKLDVFNLMTLNLLTWNLPLCGQVKCNGQPCADLTVKIKELITLRDNFKKRQTIVHDLLYAKNTPIGYDLLSVSGAEQADDKITQPEKIKRQIELARNWLTPATGDRRSCAMTELDRKIASDGMGGMWGPALCQEARESNMYWPRAWSEKCQDKCTDENDTSAECRGCLGNAELWSKNPATLLSQGLIKKAMEEKGASSLAKLNYVIYNQCLGECKNGILDDDKCAKCLCEKGTGNDKFTDEECLAWLCGGSQNNWVCCREAGVPRTQLANLADFQINFPTLTGDMLMRAGDVYKMIGEAKKALGASKVATISSAYVLGIMARETRMASYMGVLPLKAGMKTSQMTALKEIISQLRGITVDKLTDDILNLDIYKVSKGAGAMGPMQILPTTWLSLQQRVVNAMNENKTMPPYPNPWEPIPSLIGGMTYLTEECKSIGDEANGAKRYTRGPGSSDARLNDAVGLAYSTAVIGYMDCFQVAIDTGCFEDEQKPECQKTALKDVPACKNVFK
ncbi:MAG: hypothetical protein NTV62_01240 [Candidatus Gribaldobacteria bacterium]|nr:hypothetical protein [Candidatus Gribaldobacteria bacterium]